MKKKKIYSIPAKIITIAVLAVSAFVVALTGVRIIQGFWIGMTFSEMANGTFYEQSSAAAQYLYREGASILASLQSESTLSLNGSSYDESATVDITNLDAGVDYADKNPETTYTLAALDDFYNSNGYFLLQYLVDCGEELVDGYDYETATVTEDTAETDETATEAASEYVSEEMGADATRLGSKNVTLDMLVESDSDEAYYTYETVEYTFGIYGNLANVLYNNGIDVEEEYILNAAGGTLAEYAGENLDTVSILDSYKQLLNAAEVFNDLLSGIEQSNAMLFVKNISTGEIYTNIEEWRDLSLEEVEAAYIEDLDGPYYSYSENERASETTESIAGDTDSMETYGELLLDEVRASGAGYYQLFIALDVDFPLRTSSSYTQRQWFAGWIQHDVFALGLFNTVGTFFIALALVAVMLILAGFQTGRKPGDKEVHPALMDRFPLEFMLIGDLVLWGLLVYWVIWDLAFVYNDVLYSDVTYISTNVVGGAIPVALLVLLFAWECKRYGRRVKERTLGGSLILTLSRLIRKGMEKRRGTEVQVRRMVGWYWIFVALQFLFLVLAARLWWYGWYRGRAVFLLLIWLVLDIWVMAQMVRRTVERSKITKGMEELAAGNLDYQVDAVGFTPENRGTADVFNSVREGIKHAVEVEMKSERLKTDLITNVSHDIKTPLTSIINYVDILKKEDFEDERIAGYIDVLERKSQRLKQLTDDLVEASKISSGVITLDIQEINLKQLLQQSVGEFDEKFQERNLALVMNLTEKDMKIQADGRRMYRVIENLLNNAVKYSMPGSRVYVNGEVLGGTVSFTMKNMSEQALNFSAEELTERFVRGDVSRTTEGSGLGLEIAKNLTTMQGGDLELYLDGDLFKVTVSFPRYHQP